MMRIKKSHKNEYVQAGGIWVRNFNKEKSVPVSINKMITPEDKSIYVANEMKNMTLNIANIAEEHINSPSVVIVSDGYGFDTRHKFLAKLPKETVVLAVNGALKRWGLYKRTMEEGNLRPISAYVVNNPYAECLYYLPKGNYWPTCIASTRTHHEFLKRYRGQIYAYTPTPEVGFGFKRSERYFVDDYRNPICAAIGLAYQMKAEKLMLVCCDDSFEDERDASVKLENGLFTYPQHLLTQEIIDANFHWLQQQEDHEVVLADYSSGAKYNNASYIDSDEAAISFFVDEEKEGINNG